jgi:hypothetical protein
MTNSDFIIHRSITGIDIPGKKKKKWEVVVIEDKETRKILARFKKKIV